MEVVKLGVAFFFTEIVICLILSLTLFYKYETGLKFLASGYTALVINAILWALIASLYRVENSETENAEVNLQEVTIQ